MSSPRPSHLPPPPPPADITLPAAASTSFIPRFGGNQTALLEALAALISRDLNVSASRVSTRPAAGGATSTTSGSGRHLLQTTGSTSYSIECV